MEVLANIWTRKFLLQTVLLVIITPFIISHAGATPTEVDYPSSETTSKYYPELDPCAHLQGKQPHPTEFYMFDIVRKKCASIQRPDCPSRMQLRKVPGNDTYGMCDCSIDQHPTVYNSSMDRCAMLYEQEYCASGDWLTPTSDGGISCTRNKCKSQQKKEPHTSFTLYKGECTALDRHPDCGDLGKTLGYRDGELEPVCVNFRIMGTVSPEYLTRDFVLNRWIPNLRCSPLTKWAWLTKCDNSTSASL